MLYANIATKKPKTAARHIRKQSGKERPMAYLLGTEVWVNSLELIDSGIINLFCGEFKIIVTDLIFHFKITEDKKKSVGDILLLPDKNNDKNIYIELCNFSSPHIQGYFEPIEVGHINGRPLYVNFSLWVADKNKNARTVAYNIYAGEKPDA
jgi:hypothetical protein